MILSAVCLPSRRNLLNMFVSCKVSCLYTIFGWVSAIEDWQTPEQTNVGVLMIGAHLRDDSIDVIIIEYSKHWPHRWRVSLKSPDNVINR